MIIEFLKLILELCDVAHNMKNRLCDVAHKKKDRRENISKLVFDFVFFHVLKMAYIAFYLCQIVLQGGEISYEGGGNLSNKLNI